MSSDSEPKVVWHDQAVARSDREKLKGHRAAVVWFTGLSGSGKSTVANAVDVLLHQAGVHTYLLDGDNVRHGLCAGKQLLEERHSPELAEKFGLGFGAVDREENIRRIGAVTQLLVSSGLLTLTAFVSPYRRDRELVREWLAEHGSPEDFVEVFVDTPLEVCESRDPKGLYKLAREGKIPNFTGISDPYESPQNPELHLDGCLPIEDLAKQVVEYLDSKGIINE